jgi:carbonic anhydrase/acetyltransferase-like protein (isoleucine patch superfamily)
MAILLSFDGKSPVVHPSAWLAPTATLIGDVVVEADANIWFGAVLRGDVGRIRVGARSNVQDGVLVHMTTNLSNTLIGEDVTVGHGAILHGAIVEDGALVGMGSVLLDNVRVGARSLVAAGSVVPPRMEIPAGVMVRGAPAKVVRPLQGEELDAGLKGAKDYLELSAKYR